MVLKASDSSPAIHFFRMHFLTHFPVQCFFPRLSSLSQTLTRILPVIFIFLNIQFSFLAVYILQIIPCFFDQHNSDLQSSHLQNQDDFGPFNSPSGLKKCLNASSHPFKKRTFCEEGSSDAASVHQETISWASECFAQAEVDIVAFEISKAPPWTRQCAYVSKNSFQFLNEFVF